MGEKICRLCLNTVPVSFSLLTPDISKMLESLTSIKIDEDDAVSTVACTKCLLNVKLAFSIQQRILKVDNKLRNNNASETRIKQEVGEVAMLDNKNEIVQTIATESLGICDNRCKICGISVKENMMNHIQEHFQSVQECNGCNRDFKNIHDYRQHLLICQQQNDKKKNFYVCDKCGSKFRYESLYNLHMKNHENYTNIDSEDVDDEDVDNDIGDNDYDGEIGEKHLNGQYFRVVMDDKISYRCNICSRVYKSHKQFTKHTHDRKQCPVCKANVTVSNWKKHVSNHSSGPQICELCGATLRSLESLRGHMTHTHSKQRYKCEECNLTFKVHYNYLKHCKSHTGEKDHICELCGRGFITKHYLNKHIKLKHLKLRPHICEFCKRGFSSKNALSTHRRQHTNETPYRCEVCGEGFRQNVSLRTHRKSKHNIIEPKTCACEICGKEFSSRQAIHSHMRLH